MDALEFLCRCADSKYDQAMSGSIVGGHNGPHGDPETPVRNNAHWLVTYARLYHLTGNAKYAQAAEAILNTLLANEHIASGNCPVFRSGSGDHSNGVIGMGWLLEGLSVAGTLLNHDEAIATAVKLARSQPYDEKIGLWLTRRADGSSIGIDRTLNHQIWFAVGAEGLARYDADLAGRLKDFASKLPRQLRIGRHALAKHLVQDSGDFKENLYTAIVNISDYKFANSLLSALSNYNGKLRNIYSNTEYFMSKEVGYSIFTLHGLSRISGLFDGSRYFESVLRGQFSSVASEKIVNQLSDNKWSYPYNPPGFEFPYIAFNFDGGRADNIQLSAKFYNEQLRRNFASGLEVEPQNCPDPQTMIARIYPLSLLEEHQLAVLSKAGADLRSQVDPIK